MNTNTATPPGSRTSPETLYYTNLAKKLLRRLKQARIPLGDFLATLTELSESVMYHNFPELSLSEHLDLSRSYQQHLIQLSTYLVKYQHQQ